jgi:hypothetical protein
MTHGARSNRSGRSRVSGILATLLLMSVASGCSSEAGGATSADPVNTPAAQDPSPPPRWLFDNARRLAARLDDPHPQAAYWGLVRVGDLEELTHNQWPDEDVTTYVLVLVGDFSTETFRGGPGGTLPARARMVWTTYKGPGDVSGGLGALLGLKGPPPPIPGSLHRFALQRQPLPPTLGDRESRPCDDVGDRPATVSTSP